MERTSPVIAGPSVPAGLPDRALQLPEQRRRACAAHDDLHSMGMPRVNMLFIGADDVVWRMLGTQLQLASPIVTWQPGDAFQLPSVGAASTVVLREVGQLMEHDQVRLLDWLDRAVGRTQVVCTSNRTLLPQLEEGTFINALYYRLNTVCVDLTH
jgi:hypothetical protein